MVLKGIREKRKDSVEEAVAGRGWSELSYTELPACLTEHGAALNAEAYSHRSRHPFAHSSPETHGHFAENEFRLPPYSVQTIPFRWTRKEDAENIADKLALPFDLEREPQLPFKTVWINDFENQQIMLDTFFSALAPEKSLVFFYAKRTPLTDDPRRVLVGVGRITSVSPAQEHAYSSDAVRKPRGLMWERAVSHSIRPDGFDGFVLPYQEILALAEKDGNIDPSGFVAFVPDEGFEAFSNVAEHVDHDLAIASLLSLADKVRFIAEHIPGAWDRHLEWISERLSELWQLRGAFPGLGSVLHAFEIRYGTLLAMDLAQRHCVDGQWKKDPWTLVSRALKKPTKILSHEVTSQVQPIDGKRLAALPKKRMKLLKLLSRFDLTIEQASRFFNAEGREDLTDKEILRNPYRLFEIDRHKPEAVTVGTIDRGMFPDQSMRKAFPLPKTSRLEGYQDPRRVRALAVHVLANAETRGHTLLPVDQVLQGICGLELNPPCQPSMDLWPLLKSAMSPEIVHDALLDGTRTWQFGQRKKIVDLLRKHVNKRRKGRRHETSHKWPDLVNRSIDSDIPSDKDEAKVEESARTEKAAALEELFSARFSLLLGPAGTGKTLLLKMLCDLPEVRSDGILLLAPTGKARVQMQKNIEGINALTIAQFLLPADRFDVETQQYRLSDAPKPESAGTVIIDEASMVTEDMLAAVFDALKGPKRIILVGDHRQLPPIGAGRPLVDLAKKLRPWDEKNAPPFPRVGPGYTELTVHRRQIGKGKAGRDDLLLASWFTDEAPDPGADEIWACLALGETDGHVEVRYWQTDEELKDQLLEVLVKHVNDIEHHNDERGFGISLGGVGTDKGVFFNSAWPEKEKEGSAAECESWQLLTPVRGKGHGVEELNRFLHDRFRKQALQFAEGRKPRTPRPNGGERIIYGDKVISTTNNRRGVLGNRKEIVSNGEIGIVVGQGRFKEKQYETPKRLDVEFSTQPGNTFVFWPNDFDDDSTAALELAYALTVHKSQGSQFGQVFVVIPQPCFILGRELLYTALTRQVDRVVLFVQGQTSDLKAYTSSKYSEVARRYTNLFAAPNMLAEPGGAFLERGLIHRTARGELVRSISEVVVADALNTEGIDYHYEKALHGPDGVERYPDFTAEDPDSGVTVYWEHLGMLSNPTYADRWQKKLKWYKEAMQLEPNGPENKKGERLVTSENRKDGAIDSSKIRQRVRDVFGSVS